MSNLIENVPQIHNKPKLQVQSIPNTMALKSDAKSALVIQNLADFSWISDCAQQLSPVYVVGGGSNLILPPELGGLTVLIRNRGITDLGEQSGCHRVDVAAGEVWHDWVCHAAKQGWHGLENLALIPGSVGAAPVQNIGAYGLEVAQMIESVQVWDIAQAQPRRLMRHECDFAYRDSVFKKSQNPKWVIMSVRFALPIDWKPRLVYPELAREVAASIDNPAHVRPEDVLRAVVDIRRRKLPDPAQTPNAGSFFKNPVVTLVQFEDLLQKHPNLVSYRQDDGQYKLAAAWLIDQCGWKGRKVGAVRVHEKQALVLTQTGEATAKEILAVAQQIGVDVQTRFGVSLEREPVSWV